MKELAYFLVTSVSGFALYVALFRSKSKILNIYTKTFVIAAFFLLSFFSFFNAVHEFLEYEEHKITLPKIERLIRTGKWYRPDESRLSERGANPEPGAGNDINFEIDAWNDALELGTEVAFRRYITMYPTGRFAQTAQERISELAGRALHVRGIQSSLRDRGCYVGEIDGLIGQEMKDAFAELSVMNRGFDIGHDIMSTRSSLLEAAPNPCINIETIFISSAKYICKNDLIDFSFDLYFIPEGILFVKDDIEFKFDKDRGYKFYNRYVNPYFGLFTIENNKIHAEVTFWEPGRASNLF